ncbi:MAG: S1 RNA-binding domain-containing protein, partial [Acidobacteriota bacterium]|nr:S1 RNA-binding domain-containing protein [Acidobacteriota bacterium]
KKVVNPAKILEVGDQVAAIVSELDMGQRRISLSLRQTERNPWEELNDTHPEGSVIEGKVRNLTEFGAFVEITDGIDGLIHVSDMSWTKRVKHPSEVLKKGDLVKARITNIDVENQRVSLSIKEFMPNEWEDFASQHKVGDVLDGRVVNVTDFGLFIDIYNGLEGLAHVSEIDVPGGGKLEDRFAVGDYVRTRILRIEEDEKKVGLSMRGVQQPTPNEVAEWKAAAAAVRQQLQQLQQQQQSTSEDEGGKPAETTRGKKRAEAAKAPEEHVDEE